MVTQCSQMTEDGNYMKECKILNFLLRRNAVFPFDPH